MAEIQAIDGVESVRVAKLERLFEGPRGELEKGVLETGPFEIARLDNDPSLPENGLLTIEMRGGRSDMQGPPLQGTQRAGAEARPVHQWGRVALNSYLS